MNRRRRAHYARWQKQYGIIGTHSIDGDTIKTLITGLFKNGFEHGAASREVGGEVGEHGRHIRLNHTGALGHAGYRNRLPCVVKLSGGDFASGVRGQDGICSG